MSLLDNKDLFKIPDEPRPKTPTGPPQTFKWAIDLDLELFTIKIQAKPFL